MKVVVLGATGMLGHVVADRMLEVYNVNSGDVILTSRGRWCGKGSEHGKWIEFDATNRNPNLFCRIPHDADYVINCIGVIKPFVESVGVVDTIWINSIFPRLLAQYCKMYDIRLIHITTDCVYSGDGLTAGQYLEIDPHDAQDIYGRTKSLGEPVDDAMVLRTSIIGREIHKDASLVAWVQSQAGKVVNGYTNHMWNGITTQTYASCCYKIMEYGWWQPGLFHIFSPYGVSKCKLVQMISDRLGLGVTVNPMEAERSCIRTLDSCYQLVLDLEIPELPEQIKGL